MKDKRFENSLYHSLLRIGAVTLAFILIFDSGIIFEKTAKLSNFTQEYLVSSVGFSTQLDTLKTDISATEQSASLAGRSENSDTSTFTISLTLFALLSLMLLNYVLDYLRFGTVKKRFNLTDL